MSKLVKKFLLPAGSIDRRAPSSIYLEYMSGGPQMTYWMGETSKEPEYIQMGRDNAKIRDEVYGKPLSRTNYVTATPKELLLAARDGYIAKLKALAALGLYKNKIDGAWGRGSKAAETEALALGYRWDGNNYVKPQQLPSTSSTIISSDDATTFGKDMYNEGTSWSNLIGNALTTIIPMAKTLIRNGSNANYHSTGTDLQILGVLYGSGRRPLDADDMLRRGETFHYDIKHDNNGYDWRKVNGNKDVSEGGLLRNVLESGAHTLGLFHVKETPEGIYVMDNYDFNNSGDSGKRVKEGNGNWYDQVRASMPNLLDNPEYKGLKVRWFIPRSEVNSYITRHNNRNSNSATGSTLSGYQYNKSGDVDLALGAFRKGGKF